MTGNQKRPLKTYNHAYTLAFEVQGSRHEEGSDVTPAMLRAALLRRIIELDSTGTWEQATGQPFDTHTECNPTQQEC